MFPVNDFVISRVYYISWSGFKFLNASNFCNCVCYVIFVLYKGKVIIYRILSIPISKWSKIKVNFRSLTLWGVSTGVVKSFFFVPAWQLGSILQLLQQILGHFRGFWAAAASSVGLMIVFGIQVEVSGNQGPTAFRCKVHTSVHTQKRQYKWVPQGLWTDRRKFRVVSTNDFPFVFRKDPSGPKCDHIYTYF